MNTNAGADRPERDVATTLHDGAIYNVLYRLEDELSTRASHGRYDIRGIIRGIAHSYDIRGSHDSAQTIPLMWDHIRNPKKYDKIKRGAGPRPRPDFGTAYTARLLSQIGRCAEALELADENVAKWPGRPGPWLSKACALHGLGRPGEALACAEKALEVRPENVVAAGLRARILAGTGRYEEALGYARGYRYFEKRHFRAAMGLALAGLGNHKEAAVHLGVAIRQDANTEELVEARRAVIEAAGIEESAAVPGR